MLDLKATARAMPIEVTYVAVDVSWKDHLAEASNGEAMLVSKW